LCKPWPIMDIKLKITVGKLTNDKAKVLAIFWAKVIDKKHPSLHLPQILGLVGDVAEDEESQKEVDLGSIRTLKPHGSGPPDPDVPTKFKRGDEVIVIARFSWPIAQKNKENYRRDIIKGQEGTIEGWADSENRQVIYIYIYIYISLYIYIYMYIYIYIYIYRFMYLYI
jgi:hypothetical protein